MKKLKWILATLLLAVVPLTALTGVARAQHFATTVESNQAIHSSVYSAGHEINIKGTVYGDVFCAGQKVTISATVYGDVICTGMDLTISGKVDGDIRAAGQVLTLKGETTGSATVASMNFSLDADAKVGRDLTAKGQTLNMKGSIGRDVVANGNEVTLNGRVGRNVKAESASVQLKEGARIAGSLFYTSGRAATIDQKAEVKGKTERQDTAKKRGFNPMLYLFALVSMTLISVLLAMVFPKFFQRANEQISANIPKAMITGLLGGLLIIALCIGLLLSLVGIPLAIVLLLFGIMGAVLSGPITANYLGAQILRNAKSNTPVTAALVGTPVLITLYYLPIIGLLALALAYWLGFGALLEMLRPHMGTTAGKAVDTKAGKKKR